MGSPGWNACFWMIFWHSLSHLPQKHIHVQSKNLPRIINLAGPEGVSAVMGEKEPALWMRGAFCVWYVSFLVPNFKPGLLSYAGSTCVTAGLCCYLLSGCSGQGVRAGECYLHAFKTWWKQAEVHLCCVWFADWFASTAGWGWCLVYSIVLQMRGWPCC